jgi:CheY-like chemotaxis protein
MEIENIPFNIQTLNQDIILLFKTQANAQKNKLIYNAPPKNTQAWFNGDPTRIRQILTNLLSNALKFTKNGSVTLEMEMTHNKNNSQTTILWKVIDQGIGIPEDRLSSIFESFTQADGSTTRQYGGTGLGLTISKKLSEMMGGSVHATSIVGIGSTFTLELHLRHEKAPKTTDSPAKIVELTWRSKPNILVVEDNVINQKLILKFLKKIGLDAQLAENGQEALDVIKKEAWDLIFMDVQMPVLNGLKATQMIREMDEPFCNLLIIGCTANAMLEDKDRCFQAGMNDILAKPFKQLEMKEILSKWLTSHLND